MPLAKLFTGIISSIVLSVGTAFAFNGTDTLLVASEFIEEAKNKIVQFETNENALVNKLGIVQNDANQRIRTANDVIANLESNVMQLQRDLQSLTQEITSLEKQLQKEKDDHNQTIQQLHTLQTDYSNKVNELEQVMKELDSANDYIVNTDQRIEELESMFNQAVSEIQKANAAVQTHGEIVREAQEATSDANPLNTEDINNLPVELEEVEYTATLQPVKK